MGHVPRVVDLRLVARRGSVLADHLRQLLLPLAGRLVKIRAAALDPVLQRFDLGTEFGFALVCDRQRTADISGFLLEPFEGRAILTLGFLEARFEPGDTVVQAVAIEAKRCRLLGRLIALLL
jgi:hypothetical protein